MTTLERQLQAIENKMVELEAQRIALIEKIEAESTPTFEVGSIYEMRYVGDSNLKPLYICVKLSANFATFERYKNPAEKIKRSIRINSTGHYVVNGNYSFAPTISAKNMAG